MLSVDRKRLILKCEGVTPMYRNTFPDAFRTTTDSPGRIQVYLALEFGVTTGDRTPENAVMTYLLLYGEV